MTSASQSTPGATFYLAMYTALSDKRVLTSTDLEDPQVFDDLKAMLAGVERSAGDLDHLKQVFVEDKASGADRFNAIVIYESLAIEMNRELLAQGLQPMTIFYVTGATAVADVPLRYVDNGRDYRRTQYDWLVDFLTRPDIQQKIQALGWRTNPIGMVMENADPSVFNPDWGINTTTEFPEMVFPKPPVALAALNQYQSLFRKPSFTVYCLDYSGSMESNGGREQMIDAMDLLLDQERASEVLLQATAEDVTVVYGFSNMTVAIGHALEGNAPGALKGLSSLIATRATGGGTALFDCVIGALDYLADPSDPRYSYSVIAMTDGQSNAGATASEFASYYRRMNLNIPVYGIAFGSADVSQMNVFVDTGGAVYDARQDVAAAFRQAKGNN
jgi:Ca-activated chloride channel family protein